MPRPARYRVTQTAPGECTLNSNHGRNPPMENLIDDAESYTPLTVSGARNILVLDPTTPRLYLFRCVGAGIPEAVADRRELALDDVPTSVVPESLHAWLTARTGEILDIVARYRGEQYADGSRYVGQWDHPDPGESLDLGVFDAVSSGLIECYWDACDYLEPAVGEFISELFDGTPIDTIVEREVANALNNGARITADDTRAYLMSMLADVTVSAAAGAAEDYDTGHIVELLGDGMAVVSWDSCARTNHSIADLTVE